MTQDIENYYPPSNPIRQTVEILDQLAEVFHHGENPFEDDLVDGAIAMEAYNRIIRDITGVDPHWAEFV